MNRTATFSITNAFALSLLLTSASLFISDDAAAQNVMRTGNIEWISLRDVGVGYGPANNRLDAEVIFKMTNDRIHRYGFKLRQDKNLPIRFGMLDRLNEAYRNNATVKISYRYNNAKTVHEVYEVATSK